VGGSTSSSVSGTTFNDGSKRHTCSDNCDPPNSWSETNLYGYTATTWWEPPIPSSFPECGISNYTAKVKGISTDSDCPGETATVDVGIFTVTVVGVANLTPDLASNLGGLEAGSDPPTYWVCPCPGDVIVTARSCPELSADQLPACWTFTGGVEIDKLHHKVRKTDLMNEPVTFTVTYGTSTMTIVLKVDDEKNNYTTRYYAAPCQCDNYSDPSPYHDKCGNNLAIDCVGCKCYLGANGHFSYRYNGIFVGACYYTGANNTFLYKTTVHDCRILRTWHLTQQGSPVEWTVTKYDCLTGVFSQNCRTAPTWDSGWSRPADELFNAGYPANSCEIQGTPTTACPPHDYQ
jgi:hypothetical protein